MSRRRADPLSHEVARQCRELVERVASKYQIPPVHITAHVTTIPACRARFEVWDTMLSEMKLKRNQVARMFDRDLKRLRASVLSPAVRVTRPPTQWQVLVGNQYFWAFNTFEVKRDESPPKRNDVPPSRMVVDIPDDAILLLSDDSRAYLKRMLKKQLAKL